MAGSGIHSGPRLDAAPWFAALSVALAASVCLPLPGTDGRIAHVAAFCPFYRLTGLPCPGCGLTRAFVCLGHGQWQQSLHWHPLGWLVYAAFLVFWARAGLTVATGKAARPCPPRAARRLIFGASAGLLLADIARIACLTAHHGRF